MSNYIMVDGQLVKSNPEARRWLKRAGRAVPSDTEEKPDTVALPQEDRRTDWEIIEGLEEIDVSKPEKCAPDARRKQRLTKR